MTSTSVSESDSSHFLLEFPFTAARTSSKKMRSCRPQEPRQRNARIDEALRRLRVKDKSWRPCENTRSTAVNVAIGGKVKWLQIPISILLTRNTKIVQSHAMKVRVNMTVSNPPLERILNILDWFSQIFVNLACPKSNMLGHRDIWEGSEIVVVNLQDHN